MMLLSFAATNHKSLRDRCQLDLVKGTFATLQPRDGETWAQHVHPVAGIFGPNASGKSAVLDALAFARDAVALSATAWQAQPEMRREPFRLNATNRDAMSTYEFDFVTGGVRHTYEFSISARGVEHEALRALPGLRWRTVFSRDRGDARITGVPGLGGVTARELVLSRARLLRHEELLPVATALVDGIAVAPLGDVHREERLRHIVEALAEDVDFDDIVTLLRVADIGIQRVELREEDAQAALPLGYLVRTAATLGKGPELAFTHEGGDAETPQFTVADESDGTIAWLALVVPAIDALRTGSLFCVDEIDASLHSHLVQTLVGFFDSPETNPHHAQLLFTSHDTFLLSPLSSIRLTPEQVWFTEKGDDGATELFSLEDFPRHADANVAKRYLAGRYGAVPQPAPSLITRLLDAAAAAPGAENRTAPTGG